MTFAAQAVVERVRSLLCAPQGLAQSYQTTSAAFGATTCAIRDEQILARRVSPDFDERQTRVRYPVLHLYCEQLENRLTEKYRRFSGVLSVVVEVRVASDRVERLQEELHFHTEAVLDSLERQRGDLGEGLFWSGAYRVTFTAIRHGGPNYLQTAKIQCEMNLSRE